MFVKTKTVLEKIVFNEEEKKFMRELSKVIDEECKFHDSCDSCPFQGIFYQECGDFSATLDNLTKIDSITDF